MKHLALSLILIFPAAIAAQELHTFSNGEVADAEKINENFDYVLENASGGCSATQQDNSILIQCADGTSGVIAGAGTVVVYPEGIIGDPLPITLNTGDIVIQDANDIILGKGGSFGNGYTIYVGESSSDGVLVVSNDSRNERVVFASCSGCYVYYTDAACENGPVVAWNQSNAYLIDGAFLVKVPEAEREYALVKSRRKSSYFNGQKLTDSGDCETYEITNTFPVPAEFTLPDEWTNAAYPVRLEQLP